MNQERFLQLIDCHGADLDRWPRPDRDGAFGLIARSAEAAAALDHARALDDFIRTNDPLPPVTANEVDRLLDCVMQRLGPQERPASGLWVHLKETLAGLAANRGFIPRYVIPALTAAVLGGLVGSQLPAGSNNQVALLDQLASLPRTSLSEF